MKHFLYIFLYLNIYTTCFFSATGQNLQLQINGEDPVPTQVIDSLNITKNFENYKSLKDTAESLHTSLVEIGYIESELKSLEKKNDSTVVATYKFGNRYSKIKIYYSNIEFSKKELSAISNTITNSYFIIPIHLVETALQHLSTTQSNKGDAFARLYLDNIKITNNDLIEATLVLSSSTIRTIDEITIKGYEKFPKSFLKYYAGVKIGNTFNKDDIVFKSSILDNLRFVSNIKPPEVLFEKDSTTVFFYLQKEKNNLFDGIIGFASDEESSKLIFNGYLNLELSNNLNYGEKLILNYKADGNEQQNFRAKVLLPYLLKTPIGVNLELKIFKRDSTFITTEQQAQVTYQINPSSNSYIGYKSYESSNLLDETNSSQTIEDYTSKFFVAGAAFTKQQTNTLFPIKTKIGIDSEIGSREIENTNDTQYRLIGEVHHIFNLNFKNSIFLKNNTSILSSDTYVTNELFRFGGINSIRGFNENSIDASFYSVFNSEYRYQFNQGMYIHSIIDAAYFENKIIDLKEKLYSIGIGIGLQTKAGIIKVNIANGTAENQNFNFSNTKIHLSISSQF